MNVNLFVLISLLIDLIAFTLILPLLPSLLECFDHNESSGLFSYVDSFIQTSRYWIGGPPTFNRSLFGGILGTLFSMLQFISMPITGSLSDVYGRRTIYLLCSIGISVSYFIWIVSSNNFTLFVLFRIINGLSKGNVSLTTAIITDANAEEKRGKGFAMIGIAFSIGFIIGPLIGALLSKLNSSGDCFHILPPTFAFTLSLINVYFSYKFLPETLPIHKRALSISNGISGAFNYINPRSLFSFKIVQNISSKEKSLLKLGACINFLFLFIYSGLEFTLTFLTHNRLNYKSFDQGKLFLFLGILMLIYQGFILRRINPKYHYFLLLSGIFLNIPSFVIIAFAYTAESLYFGLIPYAYSSAIVIPTLTTLISSFGPPNQKGVLLGIFRSIGALARALGPLTMSFVFWRFGIEIAYILGGVFLLFPLYLARRFSQESENFRTNFE
ncbi:uncharacterized protein NH340_JMT06377 [Sarcoptes scabiei]|nr:uncharacterized protein NH340_JMT06377 [Sarcoptes scabiei]